MISGLVAKYGEAIVDLYVKFEEAMLLNMVEQLRGKVELTRDSAAQWNLATLEQLGILSDKNIKALRELLKLTDDEINRLLLLSSLEGVKEFEKDIKKWVERGADLLVPEPIHKSPVIIEIIDSYAGQAKDILNMTNQTLLNKSQERYIEGLNHATLEVMSGRKTGQQALRGLITEWAERGIPAFVRRDGAKLSPEGYVRTVMRTTITNTVHKAQDQRAEEWGINYVEVSSHIGARPKCAPYQGKIFSLKAGDPRYTYIGDTSMGEPDGLFGINCGHVKYPFLPGFSEQTYRPYPKEENDKVYRESQRQRALERAIRKAKTRKAMFLKAGDLEGAQMAQKLVSSRQKRMREFIKKTGRTRSYDREQVFSS